MSGIIMTLKVINETRSPKDAGMLKEYLINLTLRNHK